MSKYRNFLVTLNNYNEEDIKNIENYYENNKMKYLIYCKEVAPTTGMKHIHIGLFYKSPRTLKSLLKKLSKTFSNHPNLIKIDNLEKTIEYCKKDKDFKEYGIPPINKGKRTDIEEIKKSIEENKLEIFEIKKLYGNSSNFKFIENYYNSFQEYNSKKECKDYYKDLKLRDYQEEWLKLLNEQNSREILFIVDYKGNIGKSYFSKYMKINYNTLLITGGKNKDLSLLVKNQEYCIYDSPRSGIVNYSFIESIKNGFITSVKYNTTEKMFKPMKTLVFMNDYPDKTQLSLDRYKIIELNDI